MTSSIILAFRNIFVIILYPNFQIAALLVALEPQIPAPLVPNLRVPICTQFSNCCSVGRPITPNSCPTCTHFKSISIDLCSSWLVYEEIGLSMVICPHCKRARVFEARSMKENLNFGWLANQEQRLSPTGTESGFSSSVTFSMHKFKTVMMMELCQLKEDETPNWD